MATGDVLVVGSGGREHAFVWKLKKSPFVRKIYVAPGNVGTGYIAENVPIRSTDTANLLRFALKKDIDLTIVGPELPLKLGIVDLFRLSGLCIFGPTALASRIETSKAFAKDLMAYCGIPTAPFRIFTSYQDARKHIYEREFPLVIKANDLAGGKGAYVCKDIKQAEIALKEMMIDRIYGEAGDVVIIEDCLRGHEVSIHALCSENTRHTLVPAQDHKTLKDDDEGPNTGGMGVYAPVPMFTNNDLFHVEQVIIDPILKALKKRGTPFTGCLYPGLMITANGPKVLEFNARFGDPETQSLMALLANDLFLILRSYARGTSEIEPIFMKNKHAVCVVLCSKEYPSSNHKPVPIYGLGKAQGLSDDITIFHGATKLINGQLYTDGGRVLSITGVEDSIKKATDLTYRACEYIRFKDKQNRTDIAKSAQ